MDILNKILAFYAKSKGKTHKGLFELHVSEGKTSLNEDRFVRTIVAEMNKEISSIDVEYLAKSYCVKREDQIEFLTMSEELNKLSEGINPIMEFSNGICKDIVMGLFIQQKDANVYFESYAKQANDKIDFESFARAIKELRIDIS